MRTNVEQDTIAAQATAPGRGGIGIVRLSGSKALAIALELCRRTTDLKPRHAHFVRFYSNENEVIDEGLALYFPAPHSFTGESVVELQGHGGPMVMAGLLQAVTRLGARLARPGEFSERAFLNDKIDLTQAEAIADLIDAASEQAARSALRSLQGDFSKAINALITQLTQLRMYVEAAIDFPEEEIDFLNDGRVQNDLNCIIIQLEAVLSQANKGVLLKEGMNVVLAGKPNAGKSSLLNALAGRDSAIVTEIAGTTRDLLREHIHINGMPLHITDTAGLRESTDQVEQQGIQRAWQEIRQADRLLVLVDDTESYNLDGTTKNGLKRLWPEFFELLDSSVPVTLVVNKIDITQQQPSYQKAEIPMIRLSAKTGEGIGLLQQHLCEVMSYNEDTQGNFSARQRHLDALNSAYEVLLTGQKQFLAIGAGELLAEDLRRAQDWLGEITGKITADDLLGKIFSSFCIGK